MRSAWIALAMATMSSMGCGGDELALFVELQTDLVSGIEFAGVEVRLFEGLDDTGTPRILAVPSFEADDYRTPSRIAEIDGLQPGPHTLDVTLRDDAAEPVVTRRIRFVLERTRALSVLITRNCRTISCPGETCHGGSCVSDECTRQNPGACGIAACATASDCATRAPCAVASCVESRCLFFGDGSSCSAGQWCDPDRGCAGDTSPDGGAVDAGADSGFDGGAPTDSGSDAPPGRVVLLGENTLATMTGVTSDTYMREEMPTSNYGGSDTMSVERSSSGIMTVSLIRFDLGSVSSGVVTSADLHIWTGTSADADGDPVQLYQALESWVEGVGDAELGVANWTEREPSTAWSVPGAGAPTSRSTTRLTTFDPSADDQEYVVPLPVTLAQMWLDDPATNHGLVMLSTGNNTARFATSESINTRRPYLRLVLE